jgi:hypothetical protein
MKTLLWVARMKTTSGFQCILLRARRRAARAALLVFGACALAAQAAEPSGTAEPVVKAYADVRYRLELVDQDGIARSATASTLRARAGLRTREWQGLSAVVEGETITHIGAERFNDTINGQTQYPIVADPKDTSINQAYLRWRLNGKLEATAGRQALNLDNQRWIGSVGWRQNDQTLDAVGMTLKPLKGMALAYTYVWRVNRIYGKDSPQGAYRDNHIHLIRLSQDVPGFGTLVAYGYLLDIPDAPASSSQTLGARFSGSHAAGPQLKLLYAVEYARQSDYGDNPRDFSLDYWLLEPGIGFGPVTAKLGYERLEGNGTVALQTPLATLHAFNGWADKFLTTPADGLRDVYGDVSWNLKGPGVLKGTSLRATWHDYHSVHASLHYGRELDFLVSHPLGAHLTALVKYAGYSAERFATDTDKYWMALEAKF